MADFEFEIGKPEGKPSNSGEISDFTIGEIGSEKPAPQVGVGEDVARSVLAKGVRGAAAIPGMFGDIPQIFGAEKYRPPTTDEYIEKLSSMSPAVRAALEYKPETIYGRYAGSAAEFLPSALIPGGQAKLAAKGLGAIGAGIGSQAAEDLTRKYKPELAGTGYEAAGKLAGAVAGGLAIPAGINKLATAVRGPEAAALDRMATAKARDVATGTAKAPPGSIVDADLAPAVSGGPATDLLLKQSAARASDEAVGKFNDAASYFRQQAVPRVEETMKNIVGKPVEMFDAMDTLSQRVKDLNNANYPRVMGLPEAQAINHPGLDQIVKRIPQGVVDDLLNSFKTNGIDPATYGFKPVMDKAGNIKTYSLPGQGVSLRAWDEIKQGIDNNISKMYDPVTKQVKPGYNKDVSDLMKLKSDLVTGVLDKAVPDYKAIRFEASELYGARNATEAGFKYFADTNYNKLGLKEKMVQSLTPEQKQDFAYGYVAALKDKLNRYADDPAKVLGNYRGKEATFNIDKMRFALGDEKAYQLLGSINSEYLNSAIKPLMAGGGSDVGRFAGAGYAAGVIAETARAGENVLQALSFSMSPGAILGALTMGAGRALYNVRERKIAEQVLRLAADPSRSAQLGKLMAENADARSFMTKLLSTAKRSVPAVASQTNNPMPPQENQGGRIGRKAGGRISAESEAMRLMNAAEIAKKNIGKHTESILNKPDEVVVKALQIANKNLEG